MDELGFMCLIALDEAEPVYPQQLERAFRYVAPRSTLALEARAASDCEQAILAEVDGHAFVIALYDQPIPEPEYATVVRQSLFWPQAGEEMARHKAFLAVSAAERQRSHGLARAQAVALTRLAAALAEAAPSLGIYWRGAEASVPPGRLAEGATEIASGLWPVDIWLGYVMFGRDDPEHPVLGLQTRGAADYLGFELEIAPYIVESRMEPIRIVFNAIAYLMNYGDVIRDGQIVEVSGERRTTYKLHFGGPDKPGIARLTVMESDHRKMN